MSGYPPLKKPKIEIEEKEAEEEEEEPEEENNDGDMEEQIRKEQEEALVALIEHRTKEVEHLRQRITYYNSQLEQSEKRLEDTQNKLARLRGRNAVKTPKNLANRREEVTMKPSGDTPSVMRRPPSPFCKNGDAPQNQTQSRPQLVIPAVIPNSSQPLKTKESGNKFSGGSGSVTTSSIPTHPSSVSKFKGEKARKISSEEEARESQPREITVKPGSTSLPVL